MSRWYRRVSGAVFTSLAMTLFTVQSGLARAEEAPIKISGGGVMSLGLPLPGQEPRSLSATGNASQVGRHFAEGSIAVDSATFDPTAGTITGEFRTATPIAMVKPNGDRLAFHLGRTDAGATSAGTYTLEIQEVLGDGSLVVTGLFIAQANILPNESTGKFAGATGSWLMIAQTQPFVLGSSDPLVFDWAGQGVIHLVD